ncbi:hypothetical protein ABZY36_18435 [Streptomyces sp. NPDC006627]|uniref:hypothetical protein n=1 Tax=Streptomyces sp. NPDC006627 TaxID=3154679 RepID=UPI0033AE68B8
MADRRVELELDAAAFDAARFEQYLERCRGGGIRSLRRGPGPDLPSPVNTVAIQMNRRLGYVDMPGTGD